jgi:hypothetical protein
MIPFRKSTRCPPELLAPAKKPQPQLQAISRGTNDDSRDLMANTWLQSVLETSGVCIQSEVTLTNFQGD